MYRLAIRGSSSSHTGGAIYIPHHTWGANIALDNLHENVHQVTTVTRRMNLAEAQAKGLSLGSAALQNIP